MLGQNAVENNALDRLDGFTPGERSLRDRADKIYQNNQKDKDLYIRAYEAYELKASYLAAKEIVVGTWEGIRHPWDNTIVPLVEAVSSPVQTTNKIVMSYENWKAVRDEAYISDPQLAGRMDAMFDARVGANAAFMVVSGGTASAIARSPAAAKVVKSAGNLSKKRPDFSLHKRQTQTRAKQSAVFGIKGACSHCPQGRGSIRKGCSCRRSPHSPKPPSGKRNNRYLGTGTTPK